MRILRFNAILLIFVLLIACQQEGNKNISETFGSEVTIEKPVSLAEVYASPDKFEGKEIRIDGEISQVCQHKGCWIKMTDGDKELIVRFKDYGFFVPKDAATSKVTIQGIFTTEADKHVMEEASSQKEGDHEGHQHGDEEKSEHPEGKDSDEMTEKQIDSEMPYSFVAHSVIIYKSETSDI